MSIPKLCVDWLQFQLFSFNFYSYNFKIETRAFGIAINGIMLGTWNTNSQILALGILYFFIFKFAKVRLCKFFCVIGTNCVLSMACKYFNVVFVSMHSDANL